MINDLTQLYRHFNKIVLTTKSLLSKPAGAVAVSSIAVSPVFTTVQRALILLAILFVVDFITGVAASWVEFRRTLPVVPGSGKRYVIQSSKLKLSAVKFITYGLVALVAYGIEWAFIAQEFEPHKALNKMTLTTMAICLCCLIEAYSILFENLKRMGFDIIQKVRNIYKHVMKTKKEFTDNNNANDGVNNAG